MLLARFFLRRIRLAPLTSIVRLAALAVGYTAALLIALYIADELTWDSLHQELDRIYRVTTELVTDESSQHVTLTSAPVGPAMVARFPEVEAMVRFRRVFRGKAVFRRGDQLFYEDGLYAAGPGFFAVFDFSLVAGNPQTALRRPYSLVITQSLARKYFGEQDPLGQVLTINQDHDFRITAVLRDLPAQSHFHFDALASFSTLQGLPDKHLEEWLFFSEWTYVLLRPGADSAALERKLVPVAGQGFAEDPSTEYVLHLQPVSEIHLHSDLLYEMEPGGSLGYLYALAAVALFTLLMGVTISTNLSLAQATHRAKEIGVRQVAGASRAQLVAQFLGEAVCWSLLAFLVACVAAVLLAPQLESLVGHELQWRVLWSGPSVPVGAVATVLFCGLLAGAYPALVLSRLRPTQSLRGLAQTRAGKVGVRRFLVGVQFTVAIVLIAMTIVVGRQIHLLKTRDLGFDRHGLLVVSLPEPLRERHAAVRDALRRVPGVVNASACSQVPGEQVAQAPFVPQGVPSTQNEVMSALYVDQHFVQTLGLELAAGRTFSERFPSDVERAFLVTTSAREQFGWKRAVGKRLTWDVEPPRRGRVIGVLRNFHFRSLHETIGPLVLLIEPEKFQRLLLRLAPGSRSSQLATLQQTWRELAPAMPFDAVFLTDSLRELYRPEERVGRLGLWFATLAILIACLGLFGLCSELVRQRRREIAVRKTFGASTLDLVRLVAQEFVLLILLAGLVAAPIAIWLTRRWLEEYPYRVDLSMVPPLQAVLVALVVGVLTVPLATWKVTRRRPSDALRYE